MKNSITLLLLFSLQAHIAFAPDIETRASLQDYMATVAAFFSEPVNHIEDLEHNFRNLFSSKIITEGYSYYSYNSLEGIAKFLISPSELSDKEVLAIIHKTSRMKPFAEFHTKREILGDDMTGVTVKNSHKGTTKWEVFIHNVSSEKINISTHNPNDSELHYTLFINTKSDSPSIDGKSLPPLLNSERLNKNLVIRVFRNTKFDSTIKFFILPSEEFE